MEEKQMMIYMCNQCMKLGWTAKEIKEHILIEHKVNKYNEYVTYDMVVKRKKIGVVRINKVKKI